MGVNRRNFLRLIGGGSAAAAGAGLVAGCADGPFKPAEYPHTKKSKYTENFVTSVCGMCSGGCGIVGRIVDGNLVKISGNPYNPINKGTLCARGQAGIQHLYNPDRIKSPLKRSGGNGQGGWNMASWDDALNELADQLKKIRSSDGPQAVAFVVGQRRGLVLDIVQRLASSYGTPNIIDARPIWDNRAHPALWAMQGTDLPATPDIEKASLILSFDSRILESYYSSVDALRSWSAMRDTERSNGRGRVIHFGPRISRTAAKSDEWIPCKPGTLGALALGIAHMLIKERLVDDEFLATHTFGYKDWTDGNGNKQEGFSSYVLKEYNISKVADITGTSEKDIVRIGREFSAIKPAIAIGQEPGEVCGQSLRDRMAIHALNALVGSIEKPGGFLVPRNVPYKELEAVKLDSTAQGGLKTPRIDINEDNKFPLATNSIEGLVKSADKLKAIVFVDADIVSISPNLKEALEALTKVPYIASITSYINDTTAHSNLILAESTYLERTEDDPTSMLAGYPVVGLRKPVVKTLHDTKPAGDILIELAKRLGGDIQASIPWKDSSELIAKRLRGLYEARRGLVFGKPYEVAWTQLLENAGWRGGSSGSFEEFSSSVFERGGWWDPIYYHQEWDRVFKTPSKRFEFYSQEMSSKISGGTGTIVLPHYKAIRGELGDDSNFPLVLEVFEVSALSGGKAANIPFLKDLAGTDTFDHWETWAEINPITAKNASLVEGDWAWVESAIGKIKVRTRISEGIVPEVISIPWGMGAEYGGRYAKSIGENPLKIVEVVRDPITGLKLASGTTNVKVYKA